MRTKAIAVANALSFVDGATARAQQADTAGWSRWREAFQEIRHEASVNALTALLGFIVVCLLLRYLLCALWRAVF